MRRETGSSTSAAATRVPSKLRGERRRARVDAARHELARLVVRRPHERDVGVHRLGRGAGHEGRRHQLVAALRLPGGLREALGHRGTAASVGEAARHLQRAGAHLGEARRDGDLLLVRDAAVVLAREQHAHDVAGDRHQRRRDDRGGPVGALVADLLGIRGCHRLSRGQHARAEPGLLGQPPALRPAGAATDQRGDREPPVALALGDGGPVAVDRLRQRAGHGIERLAHVGGRHRDAAGGVAEAVGAIRAALGRDPLALLERARCRARDLVADPARRLHQRGHGGSDPHPRRTRRRPPRRRAWQRPPRRARCRSRWPPGPSG